MAARAELLTISLTNVRFSSRIGVFEQERKVGNEFRVDLHVEFTPPANLSDNMVSDGTLLSYASLYEDVAEVMRKEFLLLETTVSEIANIIVTRHPQVMRGEISLSKLQPPITGCTGEATVTLRFSNDTRD